MGIRSIGLKVVADDEEVALVEVVDDVCAKWREN